MPEATHEERLILGAKEWIVQGLQVTCKQNNIQLNHVPDERSFHGIHNIMCLPWSEPECVRSMEEISAAAGDRVLIKKAMAPFLNLARAIVRLYETTHVVQKYLEEEEEELDPGTPNMQRRVEQIIYAKPLRKGEKLPRALEETQRRLTSKQFERERKRGCMLMSFQFTKVYFAQIRPRADQPPIQTITFEYLFTASEHRRQKSVTEAK